MSRHYVTVIVNGEPRRAEVDAKSLLVHFLRDDLGVSPARMSVRYNSGVATYTELPAFY